jgi:hypothetical protein
MAERGSGVILSLTSGSARGSHPMMGGTGPADAATEAFLRYLAAEMVRAASASPASTPRAWPGR